MLADKIDDGAMGNPWAADDGRCIIVGAQGVTSPNSHLHDEQASDSPTNKQSVTKKREYSPNMTSLSPYYAHYWPVI